MSDSISVYDYTISKKYAHGNENWDEISKRVANSLASAEDIQHRSYWFEKFNSVLKHKLFLCGGRILANSGRIKNNTFNCYIRSVEDSITGQDGWADTFKEIIQIMSVGGGVGLSFDKVRPRGQHIKGVGGVSNGSVSLMRSIDALKYSITGGQNRGIALLFGQTLNHGDIEEFIKSKEQDGVISAANISILVDDDEEFTNNLDNPDYEITLEHCGKPLKKIKLIDIVDQAVENMLKNGEPGFINRHLMNKDSTISYVDNIVCTNPCGELPHVNGGCCCLGSIDIAKFISDSGRVNWNLLKDVTRIAVRMLDNTYDISTWPTDRIKHTNQRLRKLGIGIMGAHYFLIKKGIKYSDSQKAGEALAEVMKFITTTAYWESVELAKEKGQFEYLDREKFIDSGFAKKLPKKLRENILEYGIRNCNLTSIAPTGSISIVAETSPSLEPCIAKAMIRRFNYRFNGNNVEFDSCNVIDPLWLKIKDTDKAEFFEEASQISIENHLEIQASVQYWVDSSVSKTVNFRKGEVTKEQVKNLMKKYFKNLKGFTMLPEGSRANSPQEPVNEKTWKKWIEENNYSTYGGGQDCSTGVCEI